jgi:hypothetical protein
VQRSIFITHSQSAQFGCVGLSVVQDKGTLDALLCGDDDDRASAELLGEVWRLLAPGGAYVMITSGERRGSSVILSKLKFLSQYRIVHRWATWMCWQRLADRWCYC